MMSMRFVDPLIPLVLLLGAACSSSPPGDDGESSGIGTTVGMTTTGGDSSGGGADSSSGAATGGVRYDVGGSGGGGGYLLSIAMPEDPTLPLQFIAQLDVVDGVLTASLQPLSLDVGSTSAPREPLGEPVEGEIIGFMTPAFTVRFDPFVVPAAADPILGMERVGVIALTGDLAAGGGPCGSAEGVLDTPAATQLDGSTWGAVALDDGGLPAPRVTCDD
ncbi:MAG: hypothetical protein IPK74_02065 [Deltaproteobacteria bacterium]|nr:hypothetical protein [Deltaproteobacteria bacterium]